MSDRERDGKDQLWSEATMWFARMRSPDAETYRPEFDAWLARGALHRRYYNRASEYWVDSGSALAEEPIRDAPQQGTRKPRGMLGVMATTAASCLLLVGSTTLWLAHQHQRARPSAASIAALQSELSQFATAAGEQRAIRLADGSRVTLEASTSLRVQFGSRLRRLDLARGQARFEVAHEARPFTVFAGGGSVTAHGTVFDVGISPDHQVSVRLIKGSVEVALPPSARASPRAAPRRLQPGEAISFHAGLAGAADHASAAAPAPAQAAAARDYQNVRLADIIAEANRHAAMPIRLADPKLAEQPVSGRFRTDDAAVLAGRLAALFDLVVDRSSGAEIVLRPR